MGLEPIRLPTRPSNVRVCLFRHSRVNVYYYTQEFQFVNTFFNFIFLYFSPLEKVLTKLVQKRPRAFGMLLRVHGELL